MKRFVVLAGLLSAVLVRAEDVTIRVKALVIDVHDVDNVLAGSVQVGDTIVAEYTYDTSWPDLTPLVERGYYQPPQNVSGYGFTVQAGVRTWKTAPGNWYCIEINDSSNALHDADYFMVASGPDPGVSLFLLDLTAVALQGVALTATPPDFGAWSTSFLVGEASVDADYLIEAMVTEAYRILDPGSTPAGPGVVVQPVDPSTGTSSVTLTYDEVTMPGTTTVTTSPTGTPPREGFRLGVPPVYYELSTNAAFSGSIEVCIDYTGQSFANENRIRLFHDAGSGWVDITTSVDTTNDIVCGVTTSLSPFALFEAPQLVAIDIKPGSFPNSINLGSGGSVAVAILSSDTFDARSVDPASVTVQSAPVAMRGKGTLMYAVQDVNGDALPDLVVHVDTQALVLSEVDTEAVLHGETYSGTYVQGSDVVRIVP